MSALALEQELRAAGFSLRVEDAGRVAIVAALRGERPDLAQRRRIVALAKRHGFMSVCLELDAPLSGA